MAKEREINYKFENLKEHMGHDIECAMYGDTNAVIECMLCNEIIYSEERSEGLMFNKILDHLGHYVECNRTHEGDIIVIECKECKEDIYREYKIK